MEIQFNPVFAVLTLIACAMILLAMFGPQKQKQGGPSGPEVISAEWSRRDGILRMEVECCHINLIDLRLLPTGTNIRAIERNKLYLVEAPILPAGNAMSDRDVYEQAVEVAELNGYYGKVAKR